MNRSDRAKQFAPFEALKGLREALKERENRIEKLERAEIAEDKAREIQLELLKVEKGCEIEIDFFNFGSYRRYRGEVSSVDFSLRYLIMENRKIFFDDLYYIKVLN